jgi:hypothetical protein
MESSAQTIRYESLQASVALFLENCIFSILVLFSKNAGRGKIPNIRPPTGAHGQKKKKTQNSRK